jgi:hypothetical protein
MFSILNPSIAFFCVVLVGCRRLETPFAIACVSACVAIQQLPPCFQPLPLFMIYVVNGESERERRRAGEEKCFFFASKIGSNQKCILNFSPSILI